MALQHSGISDGYTNLFDNPTYVNQTMNVLAFLTKEFTYVTNVVGIQILNEPQNVPGLEDFCTFCFDSPTEDVHMQYRYAGDQYHAPGFSTSFHLPSILA